MHRVRIPYGGISQIQSHMGACLLLQHISMTDNPTNVCIVGIMAVNSLMVGICET